MKKLFIVFVVSALFSALIFGSYGESEATEPKYGGTVTHVEPRSVRSPFWSPEADRSSLSEIQCCLETLILEDTKGEIQPKLATSWKIAPDRKSITFVLRKGVKFHDGTDWNAEAAKFNIDACIKAKKAGAAYWTSVDILDPYTIKLNFPKYKNSIFSDLSNDTVRFMSPTAIKKHGLEYAKWHPVGTGPFKFVKFELDVGIKMERNDNYWQKGKPYLDKLASAYIKDPMTASAAMQAGEVDILNIDEMKVVSDLKQKGFNVLSTPTGCAMLITDSANPDSPFADKRVREALEYAINKDAIVKSKGYGYWNVADQIVISANEIAYVPGLKGRQYDPDKAKQLLADAGYPNGFKTKLIPFFVINRDVVVLVQSYLAKVGIVADIDIVDRAKYHEYRTKGWKNAILFHPTGNTPNGAAALDIYFGAASRHFPSLRRSDGLVDNITKAVEVVDRETQKEFAQKAVRIALDDAMLIPIYELSGIRVVAKGLNDHGLFTTGHFALWTVENAWWSK